MTSNREDRSRWLQDRHWHWDLKEMKKLGVIDINVSQLVIEEKKYWDEERKEGKYPETESMSKNINIQVE